MLRFNSVVLLTLAAAAGCGKPPSVQTAEDVGLVHATYSGSAEKTHIRETLGQGLCLLDYDRDGDEDLLLLNDNAEAPGERDTERRWYFYENSDGLFVESADRVGLDLRNVWGIGCAVGDVDGNGYDDLFVSVAGGRNRLFTNDGRGSFEDATTRAGVGDSALAIDASFGDVDNDGDLDLFVSRYLDETVIDPSVTCRWKTAEVMCGPKGYPPLSDRLYANDGSGVFEDITDESGVGAHEGFGMGVVIFDADADHDLDIFVANDSSANHLFINDGTGHFEERGFEAGVALSADGQTQAGMGVDVGDLDGDGLIDIVVSNFAEDSNNFYRNLGNGHFIEWSYRSGLAAASYRYLGWAVLLEDFDLDGDLDLFTVNGHVYPQAVTQGFAYEQPPQLLLNDGAGKFASSVDLGIGPIAGRSAIPYDIDHDGDLDVIITRDRGPPVIYLNSLPINNARWVEIVLEPSDGLQAWVDGSLVEIDIGTTRVVDWVTRCRGYLGCSGRELHFGLGQAQTPLTATVRWRSGRVTKHRIDKVDRRIILREGVPSE